MKNIRGRRFTDNFFTSPLPFADIAVTLHHGCKELFLRHGPRKRHQVGKTLAVFRKIIRNGAREIIQISPLDTRKRVEKMQLPDALFPLRSLEREIRETGDLWMCVQYGRSPQRAASLHADDEKIRAYAHS